MKKATFGLYLALGRGGVRINQNGLHHSVFSRRFADLFTGSPRSNSMYWRPVGSEICFFTHRNRVIFAGGIAIFREVNMILQCFTIDPLSPVSCIFKNLAFKDSQKAPFKIKFLLTLQIVILNIVNSEFYSRSDTSPLLHCQKRGTQGAVAQRKCVANSRNTRQNI